ncbi:MAG TPA: gas vesicle protein GvpJ [Streptosporangiaceae bacterium]|nr:gas vesicle protein GvpJ [Streptosporangiaceae bacterium]
MNRPDDVHQLRTIADWDIDSPGPVVYSERLALVDLLDRVLGGGVVVAGDITLSIAGVDLVTISLRALVASVSALTQPAREDRVA